MKANIIFCVVMVGVLLLCIGFLLWEYRRLKKSFEHLQASHQNLEQLNSELRSQRHDYQNHLQVVYGLMELSEYEELRKYLQPVYKRIKKTGKALKTAKPAVNALIKAKMDEAENRGIDFYIEVKSDLSGLQIQGWELCKVLSNLLDNAMTALEAGTVKSEESKADNENSEKIKTANKGAEVSKMEDPRILLEISEDKEHFRFSVSNNGPEIPIHMQREIFKQGVSSKKEEGHGMGLYIVSNVLKSNGGEIALRSEKGETEFAFTLPKQKGGDC